MIIKRRNLLLAIVILVLVMGSAAWYGYREFSRKTVSAGSLKADWTISADSLLMRFVINEAKHTELYTGKVLEVSGTIKLVEGLPAGPLTVVLKDGNSGGSVRMVMDSTMNKDAAELKPGEQATIRGICIGYTPDDMGLGADVLFNRSVIIKN